MSLLGYTLQMGSDLQRNGMTLELHDPAGGYAGEVFYSDAIGRMVITLERSYLPLEVVEHLIAQAKKRLRPGAVDAVLPSGEEPDVDLRNVKT